MKVLWTEGMFLTPHHLQAFDRNLQRTLDARMDALPVATWGLLHLQVDVPALDAGVLRIRQLDAVLPDGTRVVVRPGDRPLERTLPDAQGPMRVHLALPASRSRGIELCTDDAPSATARYRVVEEEVFDTTGDAEPRNIQVGRLLPALHLHREPAEGFVRLAIVELVRDASGAWSLSNQFIPRRLRAADDPVLVKLVDDLLGTLHARRRHLSAELATTDLRDPSGASLIAMLLLQCLGGATARLDHLRRLDHADPERWFEALLGLAGELLAVRPGVDFALPAWAPDACFASFTEVSAAIRAALGSQVAQAHVPVPLTREDGVWRGVLPAHGKLDEASWYLLLRGAAGEVALSDDARRAIKVAAPDEIDRIVRMKLVGVTLTELPQAPRGAPRVTDARYLALRASGLTWRRIAEGGAIAIHLPASLEARDVELVAVP